jgi:biotin-(acetyl-CoA carboxylase) ligase
LPPQKAVIIGIGVNIQHSPISNTRHPAAALQNFARAPLHRDKIVDAILDRWMQHPLVDAPTIVAQWQRAAYGIGEWIQAESQGKLIEGRFQGVNSQGALLLDNNMTYATAKNLTFINNMTYTSPCT